MNKTGKIILFLVLFILHCHSSQNDSPENTIIYWSANNQSEQDFAKVVVEEWNQQHPEIPVRWQPIPEGQSSEEVILAAVVGKSPPDVYSNMWPGEVEFYVKAKALVPLSQFSDFDSVMTSRVQSDVLENSRSLDGQVYQIPWKTNPVMMMYNKKILEESGFSHPPRTYSEYEQQARVITADLDGDGFVDRYMGSRDIRAIWWQRLFDFYPFYIAASGGKTLLQNGKIYFNNAAAVAVFKFFRNMYEKGYFPVEKAQARGDVFLSGRVATRFTGPWAIRQVEKYKPEGFEYDFAPLPVPDTLSGPVYTYGDFKNIVIFKTGRNALNAWKFAKFMISRKNDYRLLSMTNQLPLRKNILEDPLFKEYFAKNPKMIKFAKQAKYVRGPDACRNLIEIFDAISQEYEACVVYGAKSPEQAVADAAHRAQLILYQ